MFSARAQSAQLLRLGSPRISGHVGLDGARISAAGATTALSAASAEAALHCGCRRREGRSRCPEGCPEGCPEVAATPEVAGALRPGGEAATAPLEAATAPLEAATAPLEAATAPLEAATAPLETSKEAAAGLMGEGQWRVASASPGAVVVVEADRRQALWSTLGPGPGSDPTPNERRRALWRRSLRS